MPTMTPPDRSDPLTRLIAELNKRAEWAASDACPRDFYPQDAFTECSDRLKAILRAGGGGARADQREQLAALAHEQWSGWMRYLFSKCHRVTFGVAMPGEWAERWKRQMATPYAELSEAEKESDRKEADRVLAALGGGADSGCQCICHNYPKHTKLQDTLEALKWHQEELSKAQEVSYNAGFKTGYEAALEVKILMDEKA